jgi:hypothetical protein
VVAELRLAGISRDAIAACAPDLEPVTEAYEAELKEAGLTDWPGVLAMASTGYASLTSRNCEGFYHPGNRVGLPRPGFELMAIAVFALRDLWQPALLPGREGC